MREILFRGQTRSRNEWLEGSLIFYPDVNRAFISLGEYKGIGGFFEVKKDTVGQYTGLTDKNGKKIFEGDILENFIGQKCAVTYESGYYYPLIAFPEFRCWSTSECVVIGNIHDNPELLKVPKEE